MLKEQWIRSKYERKEFISIDTENKGYLEGTIVLSQVESLERTVAFGEF